MENYATYCPEDDKIRLYVGRVPRDEYETLKKDGWTSTPKQDCDFVAVWTPSREATALEYSGGTLEDEDQDPTSRAAARAERFAGYCEKRTEEALQLADSYDQEGPTHHGHQSQALVTRRAARHDMQATRAVNQWEKAEYWQQRTAGVIANALHRAAPGVRMGRIKELEASIRKYKPEDCSQWLTHYRLRLDYERQMLAAQGGRLADVDILPGGTLGGALIIKVSKSNATGRVVSGFVKVPKREGWWDYRKRAGGKDYDLLQIKTERLKPGEYKEPTPEGLKELASLKDEKKEAAKEAPKAPPLINPTDADAERLQKIWNEQNNKRIYGEEKQFCRMTQAEYSDRSKGSYRQAEPVEVTGGGVRRNSHSIRIVSDFPVVCKVRCFSGQVVILTDKPQKAFSEMWNDPRPAARAEVIARIEELNKAACKAWLGDLTAEELELFHNAARVGLAFISSQSQFAMTEEGFKILQEARATKQTITAAAVVAITAAVQLSLF